jgi:hypothetical protein
LAIYLTIKAKAYAHRDNTGYTIGASFAWIGAVAILIISCILVTIYLGYDVIDDKILILQEENSAIEKRVEETVKQYQNYETEFFTDSTQETNSDVMVLVERYPELKSDELVQQQIDLYIKNNQEIKKLKLQQLEKYKYELWLFFDFKPGE